MIESAHFQTKVQTNHHIYSLVHNDYGYFLLIDRFVLFAAIYLEDLYGMLFPIRLDLMIYLCEHQEIRDLYRP